MLFLSGLGFLLSSLAFCTFWYFSLLLQYLLLFLFTYAYPTEL